MTGSAHAQSTRDPGGEGASGGAGWVWTWGERVNWPHPTADTRLQHAVKPRQTQAAIIADRSSRRDPMIRGPKYTNLVFTRYPLNCSYQFKRQ